MTLPLWLLVNPSDPYTFRCESFELAALLTDLIGRGSCALEEVGGPRRVPLFLLGGRDDWFVETFGADGPACYARCDRLALADAFDTLLVGNASERATFEAAEQLLTGADVRAVWRERWSDRQRTSLVDYASHARAWAAKLRLRMAEPRQPSAEGT